MSYMSYIKYLAVVRVVGALWLVGCDSAPPPEPAPPESVDRCANGGIPHPDYGCPPYGEPGPAPDPGPPPVTCPDGSVIAFGEQCPQPAPEPVVPAECRAANAPRVGTGEPCYGDFHAPVSLVCAEWRAACMQYYSEG